MDDAAGQPLGDGGLADTGVADVQRVVLRPPAQDLDGPFDLLLPSDQRIDLPAGRLLVQVDAISLKGFAAFLHDLLRRRVLVGTGDPLGFRAARSLRDSVRDVVHRVETGHLLLLQEIDRVAFAFREQGDEHICSRHLLPPRRLDVDGRALQHPLEASRRLRIIGPVRDQVRKLVVEVIRQFGAQAVQIDSASAQDGHGIGVLGQCEQQVFERRVFVPALVRMGQGSVQRLFQVTRQHLWH